MNIDIEVEGDIVFWTLSGESDAVDRILFSQHGATVWWKKNGAVWTYYIKDPTGILRTFNTTQSLGKTAWYIKRHAQRETNITEACQLDTDRSKQ